MLLSQQLAEYVSACFTGLWIQSHEHEDALTEIAQLCRQENWRLAVWDIEQALARQISHGKQNRTFVVILSPVVQIPVELEKLFVVLGFA